MPLLDRGYIHCISKSLVLLINFYRSRLENLKLIVNIASIINQIMKLYREIRQLHHHDG